MELYQWLLAPLFWFGKDNAPTSYMELLAVIFTIASVFGATRLKIAQYPVGIIATVLYSCVYLNAQLYSSLVLNVYFTAIQLYGLYFWMYGGKADPMKEQGLLTIKEPPIGNWSWKVVAAWAFPAALISIAVGAFIAKFLQGSSAFADAAILSASVLAQFLLDRKQLKSWFVWMVVNVLSVYVYGFQQQLVVSGVLYAALFFNAIYGYLHWRAKYRQQAAGTIEVWDKGARA